MREFLKRMIHMVQPEVRRDVVQVMNTLGCKCSEMTSVRWAAFWGLVGSGALLSGLGYLVLPENFGLPMWLELSILVVIMMVVFSMMITMALTLGVWQLRRERSHG